MTSGARVWRPKHSWFGPSVLIFGLIALGFGLVAVLWGELWTLIHVLIGLANIVNGVILTGVRTVATERGIHWQNLATEIRWLPVRRPLDLGWDEVTDIRVLGLRYGGRISLVTADDPDVEVPLVPVEDLDEVRSLWLAARGTDPAPDRSGSARPESQARPDASQQPRPST